MEVASEPQDQIVEAEQALYQLGEQGKVIVRVLVGVDGLPKSAEVKKSSGFDRLDEAAVEYILKCRFVPGKVNGVVQAMSYDAPVNYVLN